MPYSLSRAAMASRPAPVPGRARTTPPAEPENASRTLTTGRSRIVNEARWRQRPPAAIGDERSRILIGRWKDQGKEVVEHTAPADPDWLTIAVALRPSEATLLVDGRRVHDGKVRAGLATATGLGRSATAEFRAPCDILHLFVPAPLLEEFSDDLGEAAPLARIDGSGAPISDPAIERLALLLLRASDFEEMAADLYLDGLTIAIVAHFLNASQAGSAPEGQGLVKWRLNRVQDYIESNLAEPISLQDLARCAGLSRMHFASQFRAATGLRPHEYLIRRRIDRAQDMLRNSAIPLVEVALSVGFQTQAHFTTVFRRFLDETPGRWRQLQDLASGPRSA
ncbi:MAG TPA: AraC family transcriptional regulator [Allosphingosinicella sp.]|jgi:AraC-like DNA-binding protein